MNQAAALLAAATYQHSTPNLAPFLFEAARLQALYSAQRERYAPPLASTRRV